MPLTVILLEKPAHCLTWVKGFLKHHYDGSPQFAEFVPISPIIERVILKHADLHVIEIDLVSSDSLYLTIEICQLYPPNYVFTQHGREMTVRLDASKLIRLLCENAMDNTSGVQIPNSVGELITLSLGWYLHTPVLFFKNPVSLEPKSLDGPTALTLTNSEWKRIFAYYSENSLPKSGGYYEVYQQLSTPLAHFETIQPAAQIQAEPPAVVIEKKKPGPQPNRPTDLKLKTYIAEQWRKKYNKTYLETEKKFKFTHDTFKNHLSELRNKPELLMAVKKALSELSELSEELTLYLSYLE